MSYVIIDLQKYKVRIYFNYDIYPFLDLLQVFDWKKCSFFI